MTLDMSELPTVEGMDVRTFQARVQDWMMTCFSIEICRDRVERNHRFIEEALELVQACGCTASEAHQLVDYVYGRPQGDVNQEVGGVMVTLAALCLANEFDMHTAGETELARVWTKIDKIRAKQAAKPRHSPLPEALPASAPVEDLIDQLERRARFDIPVAPEGLMLEAAQALRALAAERDGVILQARDKSEQYIAERQAHETTKAELVEAKRERDMERVEKLQWRKVAGAEQVRAEAAEAETQRARTGLIDVLNAASLTDEASNG